MTKTKLVKEIVITHDLSKVAARFASIMLAITFISRTYQSTLYVGFDRKSFKFIDFDFVLNLYFKTSFHEDLQDRVDLSVNLELSIFWKIREFDMNLLQNQ